MPHEGALALALVLGTGTQHLCFGLPTGGTFGERRLGADTEPLDDIATYVGHPLDANPGATGRELTRGGGLLSTNQDTLCALGQAVVTVEVRWCPAGRRLGV